MAGTCRPFPARKRHIDCNVVDPYLQNSKRSADGIDFKAAGFEGLKNLWKRMSGNHIIEVFRLRHASAVEITDQGIPYPSTDCISVSAEQVDEHSVGRNLRYERSKTTVCFLFIHGLYLAADKAGGFAAGGVSFRFVFGHGSSLFVYLISSSQP
jgi:hypothetical protein